MLLLRKALIKILISSCQQIDQLSCLEIIVDKVLSRFLLKKATYIRHHLICINVILQHLIGSIQLIKILRHGKDMFIRLRIGTEIHSKRSTCIINHHFKLRMSTHLLPGIRQVPVQKAINTRIVLRKVLQKYLKRRRCKLRSSLFYCKTIRLTPRHFFTGLADRTETPVPHTCIQYLMGIEHAPGYRFGENIVASFEVLILREVELQIIRLLHAQRHQ